MKYKLKYEVEVEAIQWTGELLCSLFEFAPLNTPFWVDPSDSSLWVGSVQVVVDDWLVRRPGERDTVVIKDKQFCEICRPVMGWSE